MKNKKKKNIKRIMYITLLLMICGLFSKEIVDVTYAIIVQEEPKVIINIDGDGKINQVGNMFGDDLWYPGKKESGIIRINNNYKNITIRNIGLKTELLKGKEGYDPKFVYKSFLSNMKVTIKKGNLSLFDNTIVDNMSLLNIFKGNGDNIDTLTNKGYIKQNTNQYNIKRGSTIDFKYTIYMDSKSGEELESLLANIDFFIEVNDASS